MKFNKVLFRTFYLQRSISPSQYQALKKINLKFAQLCIQYSIFVPTFPSFPPTTVPPPETVTLSFASPKAFSTQTLEGAVSILFLWFHLESIVFFLQTRPLTALLSCFARLGKAFRSNKLDFYAFKNARGYLGSLKVSILIFAAINLIMVHYCDKGMRSGYSINKVLEGKLMK